MPAAHRADATKQELLDAAVLEFAAFGYRRSSMDGIARRAGLSRATVYLHWSSKESMFRDLVTRLHADRIADMERVLVEPGDLESRLRAVLRARHDRFVELTAASPAAAELYASHDRICGDVSAAADLRARELIATFVREAAGNGEIDLLRVGIEVEQLVDVLLGLGHAAKGVDPARSTPEAYDATLAATVRLVVRGLAPA